MYKRQILDTIIRNYSEDAALVLSTHLIGDIEKVLDDAYGSIWYFSIKERTVSRIFSFIGIPNRQFRFGIIV